MKKKVVRGVAIIITALMAVSFTGCEGKKNTTGEVGTEQEKTEAISENGNDSENDSEGANKKGSAEDYLRTIAGFSYGNDTYLVIENVSDSPILNLKMAFFTYDENGFPQETEANHADADTVNLMPGDKTVISTYGKTGKYIKSMVSHIDFAGGDTWENDSLGVWEEENKKGIDVEKEKAALNALEEDAKKATSNEYVDLDSFSIDHTNQFSTNQDFSFKLSNKTDQGVTEADIYVLQYDKSGFPVSVSPYDLYCVNGRNAGGNCNLAAGESRTFSSTLFCEQDTEKCNAIITRLKFQDGTEWVNPFQYEWILVNNTSFGNDEEETSAEESTEYSIEQKGLMLMKFKEIYTADEITNARDEATSLTTDWVQKGSCDKDKLQSDLDFMKEYYENIISLEIDGNEYIKQMQSEVQKTHDSIPSLEGKTADSFKDEYLIFLENEKHVLEVYKDMLTEIQEKSSLSEEAASEINSDLPADVMSKVSGTFKNISKTDEIQFLYVKGDKAQLEVSADGNALTDVDYTYDVVPDTFSNSEKSVGLSVNGEIRYIVTPLDDKTLVVAAPDGSESTQFSGGYQRVE